MHPESIDKKTKRVLEKIAGTEIAKKYYLAGGTALAIQLGHRESIDLDWFSDSKFSNNKIKDILSQNGRFKLLGESEGTIHGNLDGVRVSLFYYSYKMLFPAVKHENINLADIRDITAMKIDAISSRGSKKDFIDLYFLLKRFSLKELIDFFQRKYKNIKYNKLHILKSLIYFDDAENEPMPVMSEKISWKKVKSEIEKEATFLLKQELLR